MSWKTFGEAVASDVAGAVQLGAPPVSQREKEFRDPLCPDPSREIGEVSAHWRKRCESDAQTYMSLWGVRLLVRQMWDQSCSATQLGIFTIGSHSPSSGTNTSYKAKEESERGPALPAHDVHKGGAAMGVIRVERSGSNPSWVTPGRSLAPLSFSVCTYLAGLS